MTRAQLDLDVAATFRGLTELSRDDFEDLIVTDAPPLSARF